MRGTLHFVPAADVSWMLDLMTPRVIVGSAARQLQLGLDDATFAACRTVIRESLKGGAARTREELLQALEQEGIPTGSQRGYHLLWRSAQEGLICFASPAGKKPAFALLDEWILPSQRVYYADRSEALCELAVRYFTSHGPATLQDFSWWSGLLTADTKIGLEEAKTKLEQAVVDGKTYWMLPGCLDAVSAAAGSESSVYLLPGFDEFILGYRDRSAVLDPTYAEKICPGGNGVFMPTIVSNGIVAGTWKRVVTRKGITVTPHPFTPLSGSEEKAFAAAADSYCEFLIAPVGGR
jgi:hypothetical protein